MKKILLLLVLVITSHLAFSNATVSQKNWRWRKDNGNQATATWSANENQAGAQSTCGVNENVRLRIGFDVHPDPSTTNPASRSVDFRISYSTTPSGPWTLIPPTAADQHFELALSQHVTSGTATTQQISNSGGNYAAGSILTKSSSGYITFSTPSGVTTVTEYEWVIKPTGNAQIGTTYYFYLQGLNNYPVTLPSLTVTGSTVTGSTVVTNAACFGGSNGSINLTPSGGTAPYTYNWGSGITTEDRTGLSAGTYTVVITDAVGCTGTVTATVTQPAAPVSGSTVVTNVSCFGGSNGSINLTPAGGTGPYTYLWNTGATTEDRTGLAAGTYSVTITDANGCTHSINNITITQPAALVATAASQTNASCSNQNNGSATVSASGGAGSYTYSWSPSGGTAATATGLSAGTYTVVVTDANGCTASRVFNITAGVAPAPGTFTTSTSTVTAGQTGIAYSIAPDASATNCTWTYTGTGATIHNNGTNDITIDFNGQATSGDLQVVVSNQCGSAAMRSIAITVTGVLPVKLVSFSAAEKNSNVEVKWATSAEQNVAKYEVETSQSGSAFNKVGEVTANSNSTSNVYSYLHAKPAAGDNYYRIKAIDKDGSFTYSSIAKVKVGAKAASVKVMTNPIVNRTLNLQLTNFVADKYQVSLSGANGQVVYRQTVQHTGTSNNLQLQLPAVAPGVYTLQVMNNQSAISTKVIMQ
ncbi:T9SS type A sorting domain-containing protein [Aridibaculum aurantiacum]|uniref:T9SS type A sorting domain-containing protein n=1 Tax=Aridibaculum aurantiacum TaxID=2810307 RepID=UPI001A962DDB|nr:T9SS type A sorting domain-containing protein [Aridibaculum aurantiacum]